MAHAYIDSQVLEVIGQSSVYSKCQIDHIAIEVLGYFKFGYIQVDHVVQEVLGKTPSYANIDHIVLETIGQWAGF